MVWGRGGGSAQAGSAWEGASGTELRARGHRGGVWLLHSDKVDARAGVEHCEKATAFGIILMLVSLCCLLGKKEGGRGSCTKTLELCAWAGWVVASYAHNSLRQACCARLLRKVALCPGDRGGGGWDSPCDSCANQKSETAGGHEFDTTSVHGGEFEHPARAP